jgi:Ca-activated chloride channel family protein
MPVTMVLNAGRVEVRVRLQNNDMPIDDAIITISAPSGASDTKKAQAHASPVAVFHGSDAAMLLPAGRFIVRAAAGQLQSEKAVTVAAGQTATVDFPLNAARVQLSAAIENLNDAIGEPTFSILEDDPDAPSGRREIVRSAAQPSQFTLPPGTYYAAAQIGNVEVRERFSAGPGSIVKRSLGVPIGRLHLSTKAPAGPPGLPVSYSIRSLDGAGLEPVITSASSAVLVLRAGRYRVEARYGATNVVSVRDVDVRSGQTQEATFEHAVALLKLRLLTAAGQPRDIIWSVIDSADRPVWSGAQPEAAVLLHPGSYRVVAQTRERRHERRIALSSGDNTALDVEGP